MKSKLKTFAVNLMEFIGFVACLVTAWLFFEVIR